MKCLGCPVQGPQACQGQRVPVLCRLQGQRADYRAMLVRRALEGKTYGPGQRDPRLDRIAACPHRGPSLPVSLQPECGCSELYGCRAGRGKVPGQVTTRECLACVSDAK